MGGLAAPFFLTNYREDDMVDFIKHRLAERSTWVGIAIAASALGLHVDPDLIQGILLILGITHSVLPDK
jgi:hypothetical protein